MKDTKELGTFVYKSENVNGVTVRSFLGIPYARAERFGMPEMIEADQDDVVNSGEGMCFPQNRRLYLICF